MTQIRVVYSAVDGANAVYRTYDLPKAQAFAQKWVGETPSIGTGYAVSDDGIGKITVSGCELLDLFPKLKPAPYRMKAQRADEIVVVVEEAPRLQFRHRLDSEVVPRLIITIDDDHLVLSGRYAEEGNRYRYHRVEPVHVAPPPAFVQEGRAPRVDELMDMDPAERAEFEHRTQDTPSLGPAPWQTER